MADPAKNLPVGGGTVFSDLKSLFSVLRTRRTVAFVYGFMAAFVLLTFFLAFNPSADASSPWFTNIFTTSATAGSDRSQFSSIVSYFFPSGSSSQTGSDGGALQQLQTPAPPPLLNAPSGSNDTAVYPLPVKNDTQIPLVSDKSTENQVHTTQVSLEAATPTNATQVSPVSATPKNKTQKPPRLSEFGEMIRAGFGFPVNRYHEKSTTNRNVLFVRREDYLAHPRHSGKPESRLSNEQEVFDALKSWAGEHRECRVNMVNGLFAHMSMKEQVQAIQDASVIIGAHGAGLTHIVSATPKTVILEVISSSYRRPHFQLIARWKGLEYHAINLVGSHAHPPEVVGKLRDIMKSLGC